MTQPAICIEAPTDAPARIARCAIPNVERLLRQMPAARVAQAVRRLHAICAQAQGFASELALAAAQGQVLGEDVRRHGAACVHAEAFRETGLRLCLDWPRLIGEEARVAEARELMAVTGAEQPDSLALSRWLTAMLADGLPARLVAKAPAGLGAMFEVRLVDLTDRPLQIASLEEGAPLPEGVPLERGGGCASVSTARGVLTHTVQVLDGVVRDYRIDAPTARRFAAGGEAEDLLAQCGNAAAVRWVMQALDPCIGWAVEAV